MSERNAQLVRGMLEAVQRGDYGRAEACFWPDAEWHNTAAFPGPRTIVGPQAIFAFWAELFESFDPDAAQLDIERVAAAGDVVVLGMHSHGRGTGSGVPIDVRWALAVGVADGRIARVDVYGEYATAALAAGLEP